MEACRPATEDDVPTIVTLGLAARAELGSMRGGRLWTVREGLPEPLAESYGALISRGDAALLVGSLDDVVVGYGAVEVETLRDGSRLGVVRELFVEPDARSVGVGETLLDGVVAFCRGRGCNVLDAPALPGARAAKNFFEQHGLSARALVMHRSLDEDEPA